MFHRKRASHAQRLKALKDRHLFLPRGSEIPEILSSICHANILIARVGVFSWILNMYAALLAVLNLVADGAIALHATVLPLIGISRIVAYTSPQALTRLASAGYGARQWLHVSEEHGDNRALLEYRAWT
jgi:hypothetical protein